MEKTQPTVLQCARYVLENSKEHKRSVKDYELDLYLGEERRIAINGKSYTAPAGAVVYRRPGEFVVSTGNYDCFVLSLDFEGGVDIEQKDYRRNRDGKAQSPDLNPAFDEFPTVFFPRRINEVKELFKRIASHSYPAIINKELATLYTEQLLYLLLADFKAYQAEKLDSELDNAERLCAYINKNYKRAITTSDMSREVSLNKNYMIRMFKERMGRTPVSYLIETRLFYSSNMLISSMLSIGEIAEACGFNSTSYFTKTFKEHYKTTPLEFRKKYQKM